VLETVFVEPVDTELDVNGDEESEGIVFVETTVSELGRSGGIDEVASVGTVVVVLSAEVVGVVKELSGSMG